MIQILRNRGSKRIETFYSELDINFIDIANALLKLSNPELTLAAYANPANEPANKTENFAYLVTRDETVWSLQAEKNDIIFWNGTTWEKLPFKITELNAMLQILFFDAENIALQTPYGMTATNLQDAIIEIALAVFGPAPASGSTPSSAIPSI